MNEINSFELNIETNKEYNFAFLSIDIAKSSKLVRYYEPNKVHEAFTGFKDFVIQKSNKFGGYVIQWEGDGGTIIFLNEMYFCVICAIEIILYLILFNTLVNDLDENINIRIGISSDIIFYKNSIDLLHHPAKVFADDIQKQAAQTNCLVITENIYNLLPNKVKKVFKNFYFEPLSINLYEFKKFNIF